MACTTCGQVTCTCTVPDYITTGCLGTQATDCTIYNGADVPCLDVTKAGGKNILTGVLSKIMTYVTTMFSRVTSSSLSVNRTGVCADNLTVELVPSSQSSNILSLGNDGKPYVPNTVINVVDSDYITWTKVVVGNTTTLTPVLHFNTLSSQLCPICASLAVACNPPAGVTAVPLVTGSTSATITISWTNSANTNYDILVGGTLVQANASNPYVYAAMPNQTYSVVVRAKCTGGTTADTSVPVVVPAAATCGTPTNLTVT